MGLKYPLSYTSATSGVFTRDWNPTEIEFSNVSIPTGDRKKLHGWFLDNENAEATLLFAHGAGGNITGRINPLKVMHQKLGLNVLIFDYRGYGKSEGECTTENLVEDTRSARKWLSERLLIEESNIILFGHSLGSAVMAHVASQDGARGLILTGAPTSISDLVAQISGIPARWIDSWMHLNLNSADAIQNYNSPLLVMSGEFDIITTSGQARSLFDLAQEPKYFTNIKGIGHDGLSQSTDYEDSIRMFLKSLK
jgi:uncharacterized protein